MPDDSSLPAWAELSDLDKGAALLFLYERDWKGEDHAIANNPARYFDDPRLTALSPRDACRHAISVEDDADRAKALGPPEFDRLYNNALDADEARWRAEHPDGRR